MARARPPRRRDERGRGLAALVDVARAVARDDVQATAGEVRDMTAVAADRSEFAVDDRGRHSGDEIAHEHSRQDRARLSRDEIVRP